MTKIFISYNRQSEDITKTLAHNMERLGHTVWFDNALTGGQGWWDQILAKVRDCDIFIFVMDPAALDSIACKREYGYAAALGKPILPVQVADGVSIKRLPHELAQIQFVDYRGQDRDTAVFSFVQALAAVPPSGPLPDPLPPSPEVPLSYLGSFDARVADAAPLSYGDQSEMLVKLSGSLRDPTDADDARKVLERLRKRDDLYAGIAEQIDIVLGKRRRRPASPIPPRESLSEAPPKEERPQAQHTHLSKIGRQVVGIVTRIIIGMSLGGAVGAAIGGGIPLILQFFRVKLWDASVIFGAITPLIIGAIIGVIIGAIIGAIRKVFEDDSIIMRMSHGGAVGVGIGCVIPLILRFFQVKLWYDSVIFGAIIGVIIGVIIEEIKKVEEEWLTKSTG